MLLGFVGESDALVFETQKIRKPRSAFFSRRPGLLMRGMCAARRSLNRDLPGANESPCFRYASSPVVFTGGSIRDLQQTTHRDYARTLDLCPIGLLLLSRENSLETCETVHLARVGGGFFLPPPAAVGSRAGTRSLPLPTSFSGIQKEPGEFAREQY